MCFQAQKSRLHFSTDCWTAPNHVAYMAVTVQFEKGGMIEQILLDIVEVADRHTGSRLATEFVKILKDYGIEKQVSKWGINGIMIDR